MKLAWRYQNLKPGHMITISLAVFAFFAAFLVGSVIRETFPLGTEFTGGILDTEKLGPVITSTQGEQARNAIIGALVATGIVTFIVFRRRIAAIQIPLVVGLDLLGVLGCMALLRVPLSSASLVGILMLAPYAIDTNILLASRVLKRAGEARQRVVETARTGLMVNAAVLIILLSLRILTTAQQIHELTTVLIFGVVINFINTWFLNAGILLGRLERQRGKEYHVSV